MAQIVYRGNLSVKAFPLLTDFQGRTVIIAGPDNTYNRSLTSTEDVDKDVGIPIVYYCHNVLPAPYGFNSVGYEKLIYSVPSITSVYEGVTLVRSNPLSAGVNGPRVYISLCRDGKAYYSPLGGSGWTLVDSPITVTPTTVFTFASVQGITYIFASGIGCYKYNSLTNKFIPVTLTGLAPANIVGITTYQGYLIAYDGNSVYWSSVLDIDYTLNSVDFTPSLITGAGNIRPEGARGPIALVLPATFGLSIYTTSNIVSAVYSGNSRYPFNFKEVVSSGGCSKDSLVAYDANTGAQYAYTTSGLQLVTATTTNTVFPEITDFLAGQDFEDFDEVTQTFTQTTLTSPMVKAVTSIADRYLIFSYGQTSLTHALIYDMSQKRFGKLKFPHVDIFEYEYADASATDAPRRSIAFLSPDGTVNVVNPSVTFGASSGVILLGKFQMTRTRTITLEELAIQTVHKNQSAVAYAMFSTTGGTIESFKKIPGFEVSKSGQSQRVYKFHSTGVNFSILLVGGFFLSSFVLTMHINGRR